MFPWGHHGERVKGLVIDCPHRCRWVLERLAAPAEVAEEIARALGRRRVKDLPRRPLLDDTPGVEDGWLRSSSGGQRPSLGDYVMGTGHE